MTIASLLFPVSQAAPPFTDDPLQSGVSLIRAVHLTEIRTRIDALRARFGLSAVTWTDASLAGVFIKAVHITEARSALADVYTQAGMTSPTYTDQTIIPGETTMKAAHIAELRAAVVNVE